MSSPQAGCCQSLTPNAPDQKKAPLGDHAAGQAGLQAVCCLHPCLPAATLQFCYDCQHQAPTILVLLPSSQMQRGGATTRAFPSLLLQELAGIMVHWQPQQRLLAHALLLHLLPAAPDGLKEQQATILLSALWHEAALLDNRPAAFVAADCTLSALLAAAPAASLPQVVKMCASLQLEVLQTGGPGSASTSAAGAAAQAPLPAAAGAASDSGSRLAGLAAVQACALLCVCRSALHALAVQLGQPVLESLAVPGCDAALPHLLMGQGEWGAEGAADPEAGEAPQQAQQQAQHQRFWESSAAVREFSRKEQQRAAAFLASWQQASSAAQQQAALESALAAVPLFKQQPAGAASSRMFQPMSQSALLPRLMMVRGVRKRAGQLAAGRACRMGAVGSSSASALHVPEAGRRAGEYRRCIPSISPAGRQFMQAGRRLCCPLAAAAAFLPSAG